MSTGQLELEVFLTGRDAFTVTTTLLDHNIWDLTRAKHSWPTPADAPMTWLGFLAWSASRRTGRIEPSMTWEMFLSECEAVRNADEEDEAEPDPIRLVPGLG